MVFGPRIALAVERAAVGQHREEARVIGDRADHAAAAGLPGLRNARVVELGVGADLAVVLERLGDARMLCLVGDVEARVGHAERIEDALLLELIERLARTRPRPPGRGCRSSGCSPRSCRAGRRAAAWRCARRTRALSRSPSNDLGVQIGLLHQHVAEDAVGEARRVAQQVLNRHRLASRRPARASACRPRPCFRRRPSRP